MSARPSAPIPGILVVALAVAACGGTPATQAPTTAASVPAAETAATAPSASPSEAPSADASEEPASASTGGGRIEIDDEQFAITIPDDWNQVVLTEDDIDTIIAGFADGAFTDEQISMMKSAVGQGIKLMAFDPDASGTNLNVLVQPTPVPISMLAPTLKGQLEALPGTSGISVDTTEVDGEEALTVTYDLDQQMADGSQVKMRGSQLYVSANGRLYVVTVTLADGSTADPEAILGSIEFLD